jgi:hypothetical protein
MTFKQIQTKEHTVDLVRYASLRDVQIEDKYFGMYLKGELPPEDKLPLMLRQLAMVDDLVKKAADCGFGKIESVNPIAPFETGPLNKEMFLKAYPVQMRVGAPAKSVMRFVNQLDGHHGKVIAVLGENANSELKIEIDVGRDDGLPDNVPVSFTLFDETPDARDGLRYKGRANVKEVHNDQCVALVPKDSLPPGYGQNGTTWEIGKGDLATTNFYTLLDLKIEATPPKKDNQLENDITATITVAGIGLLQDTQESLTTAQQPKSSQRPPSVRRGGY